MRIDAVVVNWNGGKALRQAVDSLLGQGLPPARIRVIDNGSSDGSLDTVTGPEGVLVIERTGENLGFARAANLGIESAVSDGADAVLLFNNDAVADPGMTAALVAAAERWPKAGLFAPKIYADRARGILWCCGVRPGFGPNLGALRGFGEKDRGLFDREETVRSLTGCALLVRRSTIEAIGLLDTAYFVYGEDFEYCHRAAGSGISCVYAPSAVAEHRGGHSTGGGYAPARKYLSGYATGRFLRDHGGMLPRTNALFFDVLGWPLAYALASGRGEGRAALAKLSGLWAGWRRRPVDASAIGRWSPR